MEEGDMTEAQDPAILCQVRALYDFRSTEANALSFDSGTVIEVLGQLPSGWWDGWCNGERGWFPSNYVQVIDDEDDMDDGDLLREERNGPNGRDVNQDHQRVIFDDQGHAWMARYTPEGQLFYFNPETGASRWDIQFAPSSSAATSTNQNDTSLDHPPSTSQALDVIPDVPPPKPTQRGSNTAASHSSITTPNSLGQSFDFERVRQNSNATTYTTATTYTDEPISSHTSDRDLRASFLQSEMSSRPSSIQYEPPPPSNWVRQRTEDGEEYYWLNTVTGAMRFTHPLLDDDDEFLATDVQSLVDKDEALIDNGKVVSATPNTQATTNGNTAASVQIKDDEISEDETLPVDEVTVIAGTMTEADVPSQSGDQETEIAELRSTPTPTPKTEPEPEPERPDIEEESRENGNRNQTPSSEHQPVPPAVFPRSPSRQSVAVAKGAQNRPSGHRRKDSLIDPGEPLTWSKIAAEIALVIHHLNNGCKSALTATEHSIVQKHLSIAATASHFRLPQLAKRVVSAIRFMLYASRTIEHDSAVIKAHPELRADYRKLIASASKLMINVNLVGEVGPYDPKADPDVFRLRGSNDVDSYSAVQRLQDDASEVLTCARNFIATAQEIPLQLHHVDPQLKRHSRSVQEGVKGAHLKSPQVIETLETTRRNVDDAIELLSNDLKGLAAIEPASSGAEYVTKSTILLAQYTTVCNSLLELLHNADNIQIPQGLPSYPSLAEAKHNVLTNVGNLMVGMQMVADPVVLDAESKKVTQEIQSTCDHLAASCLHVVNTIQHLAEEHPDDGELQNDGSENFAEPLWPPGFVPGDSPQITPSDHQPPSILAAVKESEFDAPGDDGDGNFLAIAKHEDQRISSDSEVSEVSQPDANGRERERPNSSGTSEAIVADSAVASQSSPVDKVQKVFGDDPPKDTPGNSSIDVTETMPWFLGYEYDSADELVYNNEGAVKGGTLRALIERLTPHDSSDPAFMATFLLTYRSFCSSEELYDHLAKRFQMYPPEGLAHEEVDLWIEKKLTPVRLRVFNILKNWVENYYSEESDVSILHKIKEFTEGTMKEAMPVPATQLQKLIDLTLAPGDSVMRKMVLNVATPPPTPILPKSMKRLRLLDIDPLELARQLTIMDSKLYNVIKPVECLDKAWSRDDVGNKAHNVKAAIEYSNQITAWAANSILGQVDPKKRMALIKHWVQVAERCRLLHNFNTCMAVLAAFDTSSIARLRRTWELVPAKTLQTLSFIRKLLGSNRNFIEYREIIHSVNPPCIPFLGTYLTDLTFIEDGNPNFLKGSEHLINFSKRTKTAEVIREIQQYQNVPYSLQPVPEIQQFIQAQTMGPRDETTMYELSLQLEPRREPTFRVFETRAQKLEDKRGPAVDDRSDKAQTLQTTGQEAELNTNASTAFPHDPARQPPVPTGTTVGSSLNTEDKEKEGSNEKEKRKPE
ncbi:hypothetical protein BZG36_02449 [Bifiguratus adelaidae]|uniref:Ras GEF n=1 Tax=Bifiguratus adelaidae TaxID=1938954 RepID=A0A261Y3K4_9FUNG|nr:hypothetical protein BZG36_02449 [Bifiguratus adelaidae]